MQNKFDSAAKTWDQNPTTQQLATAIHKQLDLNILFNASMKVLDYGTGTGNLLTYIQPKVAHITGLDNSEGMLQVLAAKLPDSVTNVSLLQHNANNQSLQNSVYDVVVSAMTMHHIDDTRLFIEMCYNSLVDGGKIAVVDLVTEDGSFHSEPDSSIKHFGFDPQFLVELFTSVGFNSVSIDIFYKIYKELPNKNFPVFMICGTK